MLWQDNMKCHFLTILQEKVGENIALKLIIQDRSKNHTPYEVLHNKAIKRPQYGCVKNVEHMIKITLTKGSRRHHIHQISIRKQLYKLYSYRSTLTGVLFVFLFFCLSLSGTGLGLGIVFSVLFFKRKQFNCFTESQSAPFAQKSLQKRKAGLQ